MVPVCPQLARRYGNVYSLLFGSKKVVVLNSYEVLKEALVTKAADFSTRPDDIMIRDVVQRKGAEQMASRRRWFGFVSTCLLHMLQWESNSAVYG